MRMDALAAALADLKGRRHPAEIHLHDPDRAEPDRHDHDRGATRRAAEIVGGIRRADLRGRLLCRPDLGRPAPARALRHEQERQRHPYRLVLEVDRAGLARRLHRRALGRAVADARDEDRCRLRRARADGARRILRAAFHDACAGTDARPARQARNADGSAQRAIRHRGRVRRSERRHLPVGQAAGQCRHAEALSVRARGRRRHQSGTGMVDRQAPSRQPPAAVLCEPLARADPRGHRRCSPKSAARNSACRNASRMWRSARAEPERSGSTCRTKRYSQRNTSAIRSSRTIETLPLPASIWAT